MGLPGHHGPRTEVRADSAPPALNKLDQRPLYIGLMLLGSICREFLIDGIEIFEVECSRISQLESSEGV